GVRDAAAELAELVAGARDRALAARDHVAAGRSTGEAALAEARAAARGAQEALAALTDEVHAGEIARAEQRLRLDELRRRAVEELGVEPEALQAEYGPDQPVPPSAAELAEYEAARDKGADVVAPQPGPFD